MKGILKTLKSSNKAGRIIFRDKYGKIYHVHKDMADIAMDMIEDDKFMLCLITYSAKTFGVIKPYIQGMTICDLVKFISKEIDYKILNAIISNEETTEFFNRLINFDQYLEKDLAEDRVKLDKDLLILEDFISSKNRTTEKDEYIAELIYVIQWLRDNYKSTCKVD